MEEFDTVDTVLELHRDKKIDWFLRLRIAILFILAFLFGGTVVFDLFEYHANPWPVTWFFAGGFIAGYIWFHRMTPIHWDEESQTMKVRRFDVVAILFIVLYVISRLVFEFVIKTEITNTIAVSIATYSAICGIMFGRILGLFRVIHDLHTTHSKKSVIEK